jgi:hypothetical protein
MNWDGFAQVAPELAAVGLERFDTTGLGLVGTLRKDGSPRISPCEVFVVDGELLLGMMWRSNKAVDLLRDPRLTVHSATCNRDGAEGDFKLYGRAVDVSDPALRKRYADALEAKIQWRPSEPYHLFAVDVATAGYISFGDDRRAMRWTPDGGPEHLRHPDD